MNSIKDGSPDPEDGHVTPPRDIAISHVLSRCNSKLLRSSEEQGRDPSSSSRAPYDLQEQLADTVMTQMNIFQEGLLSAFHQNRHADRTIVEQGYSMITAEVTQVQQEQQKSPLLAEAALGQVITAVTMVEREQVAHTSALGMVAGSVNAVELEQNARLQALNQCVDWMTQLAMRLQKMEQQPPLSVHIASSSDRPCPPDAPPNPVKMEETDDKSDRWEDRPNEKELMGGLHQTRYSTSNDLFDSAPCRDGMRADGVRRPRFGVGLPPDAKLHRLNPSPRFDSKQLESWARSMRFWRELYSLVGAT